MASKYKESKIKEEVLDGDHYYITHRQIDNGQVDYTGLSLGCYKVLEPVSIYDYDNLLPISGWLCLNTETDFYKIITNLSFHKMYINYCSDKLYFGMEFVSSDIKSYKLNVDDFKKEFLFELEKEHKKRTDEYSIEIYRDTKKDLNKYIHNVQLNISTLSLLDFDKFESELKRITFKYHFIEVNDISSFKNCLYIVVLDDYKQFYVGKADSSLKNRMRKHWTAKIIPSRHLWNGGFESSKLKFDDFKIYDTTRIFVCTDIKKIIEENYVEANDRRIEITNTFGLETYDTMNELAKAERIVINNCRCVFCLSDRTPLMNYSKYDELEKEYGISRYDLLIKQYLRLDKR